jgi:hypothetical protein
MTTYKSANRGVAMATWSVPLTHMTSGLLRVTSAKRVGLCCDPRRTHLRKTLLNEFRGTAARERRWALPVNYCPTRRPAAASGPGARRAAEVVWQLVRTPALRFPSPQELHSRVITHTQSPLRPHVSTPEHKQSFDSRRPHLTDCKHTQHCLHSRFFIL